MVMEFSDKKKLISSAYLNLLKKKDADKITVKDVIIECGISRQTFYYHFQDVRDVIEYVLSGILAEMVKTCTNIDNPKDAIHYIMETVIEKRKLIRKLEETSRHLEVEKYVVKKIRDAMFNVLEKKRPEQLEMKRSDLDVALDFFACGLNGIIKLKLDDTSLNTDKLTDQLYRIYIGELRILDKE